MTTNPETIKERIHLNTLGNLPCKQRQKTNDILGTIFAFHIIDSRLTSLKCTLLLEITKKEKKKSQQPNRKWAKEMNGYFEKGNRNDSLTNKSCSCSGIVSEMQMKMTLRYNCSPIRLADTRKVVGKAMGRSYSPPVRAVGSREGRSATAFKITAAPVLCISSQSTGGTFPPITLLAYEVKTGQSYTSHPLCNNTRL